MARWYERPDQFVARTTGQVITLNHYAGLSCREIAARMACSVTPALDSMRAGLANLRLL